MIVLAGDIGGTNSRLVIAEISKHNQHFLAEKTYPSNQYSSLEQVVACFISDFDFTKTIDEACFAVAGPVISGAAKITNLPWTINEQQLEVDLKVSRVKIINDFMAVAQGIEWLDEEDTLVIQAGSRLGDNSHPDAAILGAGTGLGASHRVWIDNQYHILPSETGHVSFAPDNEQQSQLLLWLQAKYQHVSLETILSGGGLCLIYQFLLEDKQYTESVVVKNEILENDPARVITEYGLANADELCAKALDMFVQIYGAIAGDVALHYYPVDELFIAGGIAPRLKNKIASLQFPEAFTNKGMMSENLKKISVKLILDNKVGLYGALSCIEK